MRQLPRTACAYVLGLVLFAISNIASSADIGVSFDLISPSQNCVGSQCVADIALPNVGANLASTSVVMDGSLTTITLDQSSSPAVVCSEVRTGGSPYSYGATSGSYQIATIYSNVGGGVLGFDAGGPSQVDSSIANYGSLAAVSQLNTSNKQIACYPINHVGDTTPLLADTSAIGDRIFYSQFDVSHFASEPWVSVNSILSPSAGLQQLGYVAQIHNATTAVNWHLSLGFDQVFFTSPSWCILSTAHNPQPGPVNANTESTCGGGSSIHTITAGDIQTATNSIYVYIQNPNNTASGHGPWSSVTNSFYAASAAVFAPPGTYVNRVDDKVAAVGPNNVPTQNIGSIVCSNDPAASQCTLLDQDGNSLPSSVTFKNQVISGGAVTTDPIAYVVDTGASSTLPSTATTLGAPTAAACSDPNGILASSIATTNFTTSGSASGATGLSFNFKASGSAFVPGTASCTATFVSNGLASAQTFNITMQQLTVTKFDVSANASSIVAGVPTSFNVAAKDANGNVVSSYTGTVAFSSSDKGPNTVLPTPSALVNGVGSFPATLTTAGAQTITATDSIASTIKGTTGTITVTAGAADHFALSLNQFVDVNTDANVFIQADDIYGNEATGYAGSVHVNCTGCATPPTDAPLTHGSHGTVDVTFTLTGSQSVTVNDTTTPAIIGTAQTTVE